MTGGWQDGAIITIRRLGLERLADAPHLDATDWADAGVAFSFVCVISVEKDSAIMYLMRFEIQMVKLMYNMTDRPASEERHGL